MTSATQCLLAECGIGLGSNTTDNVSIPTQVTCMPCKRGTYNDGSYFFPATTQVRTNSQCLACPTRDYLYRYAGEVSALGYSPESFRPVGSGRTTYRPGAESESECVPVLYQLVSGLDHGDCRGCSQSMDVLQPVLLSGIEPRVCTVQL